MPRELTLRQIEGFKAVVETGTISAAALQIGVSQPAMSKLIAHLEQDAGLALFDRAKRRLVLTGSGRRFYEEIDRLFAGVRQVQKVAEALRREDRGQLTIGVMPALSGAFIQRAVSHFLRDRPNVFCSVQSHTSAQITELLATRRLDVGLVHGRIENRYIVSETLLERPLVCIMPVGHPLEERQTITPTDLNGVPFVAFEADNLTGRRVADTLKAHKVESDIVLVSNFATTVCEFVAAGHGVSLIHPLFASGFEHRVTTRPFAPEISYQFKICHGRDNSNADVVSIFIDRMKQTASLICH